VTAVVTDLGVLEREVKTHELELVTVYPDVDADEVVKATGWKLRVASQLREAVQPTRDELRILRKMKHSGRAPSIRTGVKMLGVPGALP
jgi:hypothetical protein